MDDFEEYYGSGESDYYFSEELLFPNDQTPPLTSTTLLKAKSRKPTPWKKENISPLYKITHTSDDGGPK